MINDVLYLTLVVKHHTGLRVRAMVQFDMIIIINNKWLKGDTYRFIHWFDHINQFIGMKCFEGWMEYFGRKRMILPGSM